MAGKGSRIWRKYLLTMSNCVISPASGSTTQLIDSGTRRRLSRRAKPQLSAVAIEGVAASLLAARSGGWARQRPAAEPRPRLSALEPGRAEGTAQKDDWECVQAL